MIFYHGSLEKNLSELKYYEELSRFGGDEKLIYGEGIYLTEDKEEAKGYGEEGSVYTVEVLTEILDTTNEHYLKNLFQKFFKTNNIEDFTDHTEIQKFISQLTLGKASGTNIGELLFDLIGNVQDLYYDIIVEKYNDDLDLFLDICESFFDNKYILVNRRGEVHWLIVKDLTGEFLKIKKEESF